MGDNRNNSADSRACFLTCSTAGNLGHFLKREDVIGKVLLDFGYFQIFDQTIGSGLKLANPIGWALPPRFLSTLKDWTYPELESSK